MTHSLALGEKARRNLSPEQLELIQLLAKKGIGPKRALVAHPREEHGSAVRFPLSLAQRRVWFLHQLEGGNSGYHIPVGLRIYGPLDASRLQQALDLLIQRHEILRTVFVESQGEPLQEILKGGRFQLAAHDLSTHAGQEREELLRTHKTAEFHASFDLGRGPLVRGRLLRLSDDEHVLLITMHHIVSDGWSVNVLMHELGEYYSALRSGVSDSLSPLVIQYADYAYSERQWIQSADRSDHIRYWVERLQGAPELLELPLDWPRPKRQTHKGENVPVLLGSELTRKIRVQAQRQNITPFMLLYAAWALLLSRLSGKSDIVIGVPLANRGTSDLEPMVGFLVNTLALRVQIREDASIEEFLAEVRETALAAYEHQDVPFDAVVEELRPTRSLAYNPIFQVMFGLQNISPSRPDFADLSVRPEQTAEEPAICDILLSLEENELEILGVVSYAADLFTRETVESWVRCLYVILDRLAHDRATYLGDLQILPGSLRNKLTLDFNQTSRNYPEHRLIHELFEDRVRATPDAVAVVCDAEHISYSQLSQRANGIARALRSHGVCAGDYVGTLVERDTGLVVTFLGILKTGAAYIPFDVNCPKERLARMLTDCAPIACISQQKFADSLAACDAQIVTLESIVEDMAAASEPHGIDPPEASCSLAYVIYTSGSTGIPKGVMVEHRGIVNLIHWCCSVFDLRQGSRSSCVAAVGFDAIGLEIWPTLCAGATLVLAPQSLSGDVEALLSWWSRQPLDVSFLPTPIAQVAFTRGAYPLGLQSLLVGGDRLSSQPDSRTFALINNYGPTEITVVATAGHIQPSNPTLHIGGPIWNTQIYILDRRGHPVPPGVAGEICIGGAGVARGYLSRPDLTSERFIADRFGITEGGRLYCSGDLGRWLPDGAIEYLGRNDNQVKIRGFRVELGEIEAQLSRHERVRDSVVVAREDVLGQRRLVAYVIPQGIEGTELTVVLDELRSYLKASLPEYMVPSAVVFLESLPLTPNGKLDRRALPAPDQDAYVNRGYVAPKGEVERILAGIWQELLHVERVGRLDDFFELGGHSLLIVHLMERLRRVGLTTEVRRVFESPRLLDLASELSAVSVEQFEVPRNLIPIGCTGITPEMLPLVELEAGHIERIARAVPGGMENIQDIYPLAPLQEGILFHHLLNRRGGDAYARAMLFSFSTRQRLSEFVRAMQTIIDRHDILRTAVMWEQLPRPVQVVFRQVVLPVEELALDPACDVLEEFKERMKPERQRLDLRQAPLMRLETAPDQRGTWYALIQTHHLVCDNQSLDILTTELVEHLQGKSASQIEALPYRNYVAQALTHARTHNAEGFFRDKLGDIEEPTAPFGLMDVRGDGGQLEESCRKLEPALAAHVRFQARRLGASAATLFHAAWALVVSRVSGRDDVVFGTVLLGRLQGSAGAQRTLGMFINTLPLRLRLRGITSAELVEQTQRELVELLEYEQSSLAVAQRCSGVPGAVPLFNTLLNYRHNIEGSDKRWANDMGIKEIGGQGGTNYPITLSVDDLGNGFELIAQTDRRIDPGRIVGYMYEALRTLVESLERGPKTLALSLGILPEEERRRVVEEFNPTQVTYPQDRLIHDLFEDQVERSPDAVAVVYESQSLTYAQLNSRASQLARYLIRSGVGPDERVGICVERGLEMVTGLLGILKAGGGYVPLDPSYPVERLQYMLEDASPKVLLTQARLMESLPFSEAKVIALDAQWSEIAQLPTTDQDAATLSLTGHNLAYVIYTSGSTGKPKGVTIEHRNVTRLFAATEKWFGFNEHDVWTLFHSFAFDFSVWELWGALLYGGRVVVVPHLTARSPLQLFRVLCAEGVTVLNQTPSAFAQLIQAQEESPMEHHSLRVVIFGGEALELHRLRSWVRRNGAVKPQLVNMYGITETTVHVTYRLLTESDIESERGSLIGGPIDDLKTYLLDAYQQPVPIGAPGELYIGGAGVARGYLNRPELTAERFTKDPFSSEPLARMYRTGDLGRWREDGTIEYLGRNDHQVKIRGFRIELGEIEAQLLRHEQIKEAVVLARDDGSGGKCLVAYVVPRHELSQGLVSAESLRPYLKETLPEHMIPAAFVALEHLPLTPNGKLDRRALPAPELNAYVSREYQAPATEIEQELAGIWSDILRVERVGRHDDFFELGGHSLHGIKLVTRIAERLGVTLPITVMFQSPILYDMAVRISELRSGPLILEKMSEVGDVDLDEGII